MVSEPRLKIKLLPGWKPVNNPNAYVCIRESSVKTGELQFSSAVLKPDKVLQKVPTKERLIEMCWSMARGVRGGRELSNQSGTCDFGVFGTVAVSGDSPARFQVWVLSNGRAFVLVTHTSDVEPDPAEIREANEIALMARFD